MTSDPTRGRDFSAAVRVAGVAEGRGEHGSEGAGHRSSRGSRAIAAAHPGRPAGAGRGTEAPPREGGGVPRAPLGWSRNGTWSQGQPLRPSRPLQLTMPPALSGSTPHPPSPGAACPAASSSARGAPAPQSLKLPLGLIRLISPGPPPCPISRGILDLVGAAITPVPCESPMGHTMRVHVARSLAPNGPVLRSATGFCHPGPC